MNSSARRLFNEAFSEQRYHDFVAAIRQDFPGQLDFRVAETPVFIGKDFAGKLTAACEGIIDVIRRPDFCIRTAGAIPPGQNVAGENSHTSFLALDFAVCRNEDGVLEPQLIELQGFPSVFGYQAYLSEMFRRYYPIPDHFRYAFVSPEREEEAYVEELRALILEKENPENVILLEIYPERQKTRIDFAVTEKYLGVKPVCYTRLKKDGERLFYEDNGKKKEIRRIYNRLIFDDLRNFPEAHGIPLTEPLDVQWVGHPNWFFRISKFMMPYLSGPYVPETRFVASYKGHYPADLGNYVLKPLFSFAGAGVELHVTKTMLDNLPDPENFILQRKVAYEPVIRTVAGDLVKTEIRMLYIWPEQAEKPVLLTALSRLSRGEMIGVRFNKDRDWVGSSAVFFEGN